MMPVTIGENEATMKLRVVGCALFHSCLLLVVGLQAQDDHAGIVRSDEFQSIKNPLNHPPFQKFVPRPSGPINYLLTKHGTNMVKMSNDPNLRRLLKTWQIDVGQPIFGASVARAKHKGNGGPFNTS